MPEEVVPGDMAAEHATRQNLTIDIIVESALWAAQPDAESLVRRAVCAAARALPAAVSTNPAELAIVLADDSAIRALNRDWRSIDKATNVLSFPAAQPMSGPQCHLGDIVIAYETTAREAAAEGKRYGDHLAHLAVHGFLHLIGYDHDTDEDAEAMESLERMILAHLEIDDPYAARQAVTGHHA
jgi:probable rRNA maturation factor